MRWHKFIGFLSLDFLSASYDALTIFLISSNFEFHPLSHLLLVTCKLLFQWGKNLIKLERRSSKGPLVIVYLYWRQTAVARILWPKPKRLLWYSYTTSSGKPYGVTVRILLKYLKIEFKTSDIHINHFESKNCLLKFSGQAWASKASIAWRPCSGPWSLVRIIMFYRLCLFWKYMKM